MWNLIDCRAYVCVRSTHGATLKIAANDALTAFADIFFLFLFLFFFHLSLRLLFAGRPSTKPAHQHKNGDNIFISWFTRCNVSLLSHAACIGNKKCGIYGQFIWEAAQVGNSGGGSGIHKKNKTIFHRGETRLHFAPVIIIIDEMICLRCSDDNRNSLAHTHTRQCYECCNENDFVHILLRAVRKSWSIIRNRRFLAAPCRPESINWLEFRIET